MYEVGVGDLRIVSVEGKPYIKPEDLGTTGFSALACGSFTLKASEIFDQMISLQLANEPPNNASRKKQQQLVLQ